MPSSESPDPTVPTIQNPPSTIKGILRQLGPGMILAGSIVGSGELIATTCTGAVAGFSFLWLIIFGCLIKVFTQIELARYSISSGKTTLWALKDVPGGTGIVLFWLIMFTVGIGQLGGIVGGVGQALSISVPLTPEGKAFNTAVEHKVKLQALSAQWENSPESMRDDPRMQTISKRIAELRPLVAAAGDPVPAKDDKIWAVIIGVLTAMILLFGSFGFIERFSMVLVAGFTLLTVVMVFALQSFPAWRFGWAEISEGLFFGFPEKQEGLNPLTTALATFGIIGVGAAELIAYPYWCLEKGYGQWTGPRDSSDAWEHRAKGWLRVMRWDAWCSMVVYTVSTIAFYLLGASVLHRSGLVPKGTELIRTLGVMYEPVFGALAQSIFLVGAFAVLFSTFFVANAAKARLCTDVMNVFGLKMTPPSRKNWIRLFSVVFPMLCVVVYVLFPKPVVLVLLAGTMQALLLPMLGLAVLYFRYKLTDERLRPNIVWDIMLWLSFICFLGIGLYLAFAKVSGFFAG